MTEYHPAGSCDACADVPDPLDLITWRQFRAAFQIATMALLEIESGSAEPGITATATAALRALEAEVGRFDVSEPSWKAQG